MVELYPHNQKAYDAVMSHFTKGNKMACVIQPCGTGKAVVLAAVANHFDKVYMVAPNEHIHNQAKTVCDKELNCITYQSLAMDGYDYPTDADLIVFDEMHRMGAMNWSKGCERLMQSNPNAHILGLTATPVRALEQRDMAKVYFDGHVVNEMSLTDAWCQGVLKAPQKYVIGMVSMDNEEKDMLAKIRDSKRMDEETKQRASAKVINVCRDWSLSNGVPRIIKKYWDNSIKKVAVFCPTITMADTIESTLRGWFKDAGYDVNHIYVVHSEENGAAEKIKAFEDEDEGLNVLVSVSMLNEGIHPKGVGSVILLRSTISRNLYLQQIGRCFSVGQETAPIIFDFADNLTTVNCFDGVYVARDEYNDKRRQVADNLKNENDGGSFVIVDTLVETRKLIAEIEKEFPIALHKWTTDEIIDITKRYDKFSRFAKEQPALYSYLRYHNGLDEYCGHMQKQSVWDKDKVLRCALECTTKKEFKTKYVSAYNTAIKRGWIDEVCGHMKTRYRVWTDEELRMEAKKYNYKTDFAKNSRSAYDTARKRGIFEEICAHMKEKYPKVWNPETIKTEALKYRTRRDFKNGCFAAYDKARKLKILQEVCTHMEHLCTKWTLEKIAEVAKQYSSRQEFKREAPNAYAFACKNKLLDIVCSHMNPKRTWK